MTKLALLGPQRHHQTISEAVRDFGLDRPLAAITAGWQEREAEIEELDAHLGQKTVNLLLHQRGDDVFSKDAEYQKAHRKHQENLRRLQELYRLRLNHAQATVGELLGRSRPIADLLEPEIEDAIQVVRQLDEHHLDRIRQLNREFEEKFPAASREAVAQHREELEKVLDQCGGLLIAGGHVAVLLNRMRLFGINELWGKKPIIAWSAGAMVLGERVVLFHDSPPQGPGYAEVFEAGFGRFGDLIPLPHGHKRLLLDNQRRVTIFARRFGYAHCAVLAEKSRIDHIEDHWIPRRGIRKLEPNGSVIDMEAL